MASLIQLCKRVWRRKPLPPMIFPNVPTRTIDSTCKVEEKTLPSYEAEQYYPVRICEIFSLK